MPSPTTIIPMLLVSAMTSACATTGSRGTRPDDMTATEHLAQAREASLRAATPDGAYPYALGPHGFSGHGSHWSPWYYYWDPRAEYAALADAHRAAADELRVRYESACALVPRGAEAVSPLGAYVTASETLDRGLVVQLAPEAGPLGLIHSRGRLGYVAITSATDACGARRRPDGGSGLALAE